MIRLILVTLLLAGCGSSNDPEASVQRVAESHTFVVVGQSNAVRCNWGYYERISGNDVINLAVGGKTIDELIDLYDPSILAGADIIGVFVVHGEADGKAGTDPEYYASRLKVYQEMIADSLGYGVQLYISTVGYRLRDGKESYDAIRKSVRNQGWVIAWNKAQFYSDWGMLVDSVHFTRGGCRLMMESFNDYDGVKPSPTSD